MKGLSKSNEILYNAHRILTALLIILPCLNEISLYYLKLVNNLFLLPQFETPLSFLHQTVQHNVPHHQNNRRLIKQ